MNFKHLLILGALTFTQGLWAYSGEGTSTSPYLIESEDDFIQLASDVNLGTNYEGVYFELTTDLDFKGASLTPIGTYIDDGYKQFSGVFNGKGHTISQFALTENLSTTNGIFGEISKNAEVCNLTVSKATINAIRYTGAIVGYSSGTVRNCHVKDDVVFMETSSSNTECGGIVGLNYGYIEGCTCAANINLPKYDRIGGIVGYTFNGLLVKDCLYLGNTVNGKEGFGAITGENDNNSATLANNYYTTKTVRGVGIDNSKVRVFTDVEGGAELASSSTSQPSGIGSMGTAYGEGNYVGITPYENGLYYNGKYYTTYQPDGTTDNPYYIISTTDLTDLAASVASGQTYEGKNILLMNDLTFIPVAEGESNYTPIGNSANKFKGLFNGKAHTISGIVVNTSEQYVGVFGYIGTSGEVKNLTLTSSHITGGWQTGGIAGQNDGTVENCHVAEDVTLQLYHENNSLNQILGGIAGWNSGTIAGCTNMADLDVVGYREIGGIAGYSNRNIMDCLFFGNITVSECKEQVGAIVGSQHASTGELLTNNFYTDLTIRGIGKEDAILGEDVEGALYAQAYSESELPVEIGNVVRDYGNDGDITMYAYAKGLHDASTGKYYYPGNALLVLFDGEDNTAAIEPYIGRTVNVRLQGRYLYKDGTWNTLCLPFDVKIPGEGVTNGTAQFEGAEFMEITTAKFDNGTLNLKFNSLVGCSAGEPFLVRWPVAEGESVTTLNPIFENVKIGRITSGPNPHYLMTPIDAYAAPHYPVYEGNPDNLLVMKGSYGPVTLSAGDRTKLYLCAENTLYYPEADVTLGAFRCYFELLGGLTAGDHPNEVNAFNLNFGDNDASAIKDVQSMVNVQSSMFNVQWYTLDGRRLNGMPTQRGIYIVGGKKVVIK